MTPEAAARLDALICRIFGHKWHHWEAGHVHAGDDWDGPTLSDGTPWAHAFRSCDRCGTPEQVNTEEW